MRNMEWTDGTETGTKDSNAKIRVDNMRCDGGTAELSQANGKVDTLEGGSFLCVVGGKGADEKVTIMLAVDGNFLDGDGIGGGNQYGGLCVRVPGSEEGGGGAGGVTVNGSSMGDVYMYVCVCGEVLW